MPLSYDRSLLICQVAKLSLFNPLLVCYHRWARNKNLPVTILCFREFRNSSHRLCSRLKPEHHSLGVVQRQVLVRQHKQVPDSAQQLAAHQESTEGGPRQLLLQLQQLSEDGSVLCHQFGNHQWQCCADKWSVCERLFPVQTPVSQTQAQLKWNRVV